MVNRTLPAMCMVLALAGACLGQGPAPGVAALPMAPVPPLVVEGAVSQAVPGPPAVGGAWISADFLIGSIHSPAPPPLVTTSPPGTPRAVAGVANAGGTTGLFPLGQQNDDARVGLRLQGGCVLLAETGLRLEGGAMFWESQASLFTARSDGSPILARPYTNAVTGASESVLVAFPGLSTGSVNGKVTSGNLYEANLGVYRDWFDCGWFRFGTLLGYRFYNYDEGLAITQTISPVGGAFVAGTQVTSADSFTASNQFHGCNVGARANFEFGGLTLGLLGSVAAGNLRKQVNIRGVQTVTVPGAAPVVNQGGVYALGSNIGSHVSNDAAVMPEVGVNLSWQATRNLRLRAGYTLLVLGQVAAVGPQVDTVINTALLPPAARAAGVGDRPAFAVDRRDIWAHALSLGGEFVW